MRYVGYTTYSSRFDWRTWRAFVTQILNSDISLGRKVAQTNHVLEYDAIDSHAEKYPPPSAHPVSHLKSIRRAVHSLTLTVTNYDNEEKAIDT